MPSANKHAVAEPTDLLITGDSITSDRALSFFFDRFPRLLKKGRGSHKSSRVGPDIWDDDDDDDDGYHGDSTYSDDGDDSDSEMYKVYLTTLGKCKRHHHQRQRQQQQQQRRLQYNLQIQIALAQVLQKTCAHKKASSEENSRLLSTVTAAATAGKKPSTSSCRYMMMLLETPVDQVIQGQHPVRQALLQRRKSFLDATVVITPCMLIESTTVTSSLKKEGRSYWSRIRRSKTNKKKNTMAAAVTPTTIAAAVMVDGKAPSAAMMLCASSFRTASMAITAGDDQDNVPLGLLRKKRAIV